MTTSRVTQLADLVGWTPVELVAKPASQAVQWADLGSSDFGEPTFRMTVERRLACPDTRTKVTGLEALPQLAAMAPHLSPSGFIFHMSRVGSTLLANALRALPSSLVIVEPRPLNQLLVSPFRHSRPADWSTWLAGLLAVLGQPRRPDQKHYFVKFSSHNVLQLDLIRRIFPEVPWLFLYRDPVDVMVSNLERPARWYGVHRNPPAGPNIFDIAPDRLRSMSPAAFFAEVFRAFCHAALAAAPAGGAFVNYNQLTPRSIAAITAFFGVGGETEALPPERLQAIFSVDAKDIGRRKFTPDARAKQARADPHVLQLCEEFLAEPYRQLEERRLRL